MQPFKLLCIFRNNFVLLKIGNNIPSLFFLENNNDLFAKAPFDSKVDDNTINALTSGKYGKYLENLLIKIRHLWYLSKITCK